MTTPPRGQDQPLPPRGSSVKAVPTAVPRASPATAAMSQPSPPIGPGRGEPSSGGASSAPDGGRTGGEAVLAGPVGAGAAEVAAGVAAAVVAAGVGVLMV